jgi:hypothetical protein
MRSDLAARNLVFRLARLGVDPYGVFRHAIFSALGFRDSGFRAFGHGDFRKGGRAGGTRRAIGIERN